MKSNKLSLFLALSAIALAANTASAATAKDTHFYAGYKAGLYKYVNRFANPLRKPSGFTNSLYAGYNATKNFALELGVDYIGKTNVNFDQNDDDKNDVIHKPLLGAYLALKAGTKVVNDNADIYAFIGYEYLANRYVQKKDATERKASGPNYSPILGIGASYYILPNLSVKGEYKYVFTVGKESYYSEVTGVTVGKKLYGVYKPKLHLYTIGLTYHFGEKKAPLVVEDKSQVVSAFSLDSSILFDLSKDKLSGKSSELLSDIADAYNTIESDARVEVIGHTDRTGSKSFNDKLSVKRAETVVKYLVNKGIPASNILFKGVGSQEPITNGCVQFNNNKIKLIECLAPDRRVEVLLTGKRATK